MIEQFNSYALTDFEQVVLFLIAGTISMLYHYADRWVKGEERLLDSADNIWDAIKILIQLFVGSTVWTDLYVLSNMEVLVAGITIGFLAFSQGLAKFVGSKRK